MSQGVLETSKKKLVRKIGRAQDFDRELGLKLRMLRIISSKSQAEIGNSIGISSQQIQNYELGKHRIAAGTLQMIGDALGVHPGIFFFAMPSTAVGIAELRNSMRMVIAIQQIPKSELRKDLINRIDALLNDSVGDN